ncbi:MAG TPA: DoxX family protein [Candidatus Paceibacterota bacterium]|nr:DoxX family protein [Candidatus Paceibacterota bacterium]
MAATIFLIGRIIFGGFFLYNAYRHFTNLTSMTMYVTSKRVPFPKAAVITTGVMLALGGLAIVSGKFMILGMIILVLFLVPVAFAMHAFWKETDPHMKAMQIVQFSKDIALAGALLMLIAIGLIIG